MTTFALIHGAWGTGWHWGPLAAELQKVGHQVVAPDLPCEDPDAVFDDYADVVIEALSNTPGGDVVAVGYSLGGHTAPLVAARRPVRALVYLAAMVPEPGVSLIDQFVRRDRMLLPEYKAGLESSDRDAFSRWVDFDVYYRTGCYDCQEPVARERFERSRSQCNRPYRKPCSLTGRLDVPTRYILCSEDRIMDNSFWQTAVRERVGTDPVAFPSSHSPMASRPEQLSHLLTAGLTGQGAGGIP